MKCVYPKKATFLTKTKTIMSATATEVNFPVLCIPRAMLFHTTEIVENAFNHAIGGKFVKSVGQSTTTDKSGTEFNVFFIHPDQDFKANRNTETLYKNLKTEGIVNISTGSGKYFWKVKLYVPHMKAQYLPPKPVEVPVPVGPRIMTETDLAEFRKWQAEKAEKVTAEAAALAEKAAAEAAAAAELNALGQRLYPLVCDVMTRNHKDFLGLFIGINFPGKVTGMLLEMPRKDILNAIENAEQLSSDVAEAIQVLREHLSHVISNAGKN